jgi:hypothetical protein
VPRPVPVQPEPKSAEPSASFLDLVEDVLAGGSVMGRHRPGIRQRFRRWLLPVGTSGEPLILFCGWLVSLSIALAAYADVGPFSEPGSAVLMLTAEGAVAIAVLLALGLAKARRRARASASPDETSGESGRTHATS